MNQLHPLPSKNGAKPRSLRRELVALIVFALVPMLVFSLIVALWGAWLQTRSVEAGVHNTTSALALAVGREVESWKATLRTAAQSRLLDDRDYGGMHARLGPLAVEYEGWFSLIDRDGRQLLNTAVPHGTPLPIVHESDALAEVFRTRQPVLSGLARSNVPTEDVVSLFMPVVRNHDVIHVLALRTRPQRLARLMAGQPLPPQWRATLLDGDNRVIADTGPLHAEALPMPATFVARDRRAPFVDRRSSNGQPELVSFEPLLEGNWTVAVTVPRAVIDRDSVAILGAMTFGGIALLLLAIWLSGRVAGRIEAPVRALAQRAEHGFGSPVAVSSTSVRELAELERAFARATTLERERSAEREHRLALEVAHRAKDEFLATLSHELRTPLQAALGWLHVLRAAGAEAATRDKAVPVIERNLRQLGQLVDDLIDASRIVSGKVALQLEPLDLARLVTQTAETWQPAIAAKQQQLQLSIEDDVWVNADRARMAQVISNLIANSVKFTPGGGCIEVRLTRRDGVVEVAVHDSGDGIEPSALPLVFSKFWQAQGGTERRHQGLGLGLAIVKSLVELQGGQVAAASGGLGCGAEFTVRLPLVDAPALTEGARVATASARLADVAVLLVDDEVDAGSAIAQLLLLHGADVTFVHSAREALAALDAGRFDIVLSDIAMPEQDGVDLLRELRVRGHRLPVIAVTAFATGADRQRVTAAGFDQILTKPIDPEVAVAAMLDALCLGNGGDRIA
jgi:signal transduction histidine kinase/ActR/RegA family two-component response regulator